MFCHVLHYRAKSLFSVPCIALFCWSITYQELGTHHPTLRRVILTCLSLWCRPCLEKLPYPALLLRTLHASPSLSLPCWLSLALRYPALLFAVLLCLAPPHPATRCLELSYHGLVPHHSAMRYPTLPFAFSPCPALRLLRFSPPRPVLPNNSLPGRALPYSALNHPALCSFLLCLPSCRSLPYPAFSLLAHPCFALSTLP